MAQSELDGSTTPRCCYSLVFVVVLRWGFSQREIYRHTAAVFESITIHLLYTARRRWPKLRFHSRSLYLDKGFPNELFLTRSSSSFRVSVCFVFFTFFFFFISCLFTCVCRCEPITAGGPIKSGALLTGRSLLLLYTTTFFLFFLGYLSLYIQYIDFFFLFYSLLFSFTSQKASEKKREREKKKNERLCLCDAPLICIFDSGVHSLPAALFFSYNWLFQGELDNFHQRIQNKKWNSFIYLFLLLPKKKGIKIKKNSKRNFKLPVDK